MTETIINVIKIFTVGFLSFILAFSITPSLTNFLYKYKLWKRESKTKSIDGKNVDYFERFHSKEELKVPRLGGLLIWLSVVFLSFLFLILSSFFDFFWIQKINFLSRDQTWLPLFTLVAAALVGIIDDLLQVLEGVSEKYIKKGLSLRYRIFLVSLIGAVGAWWFYFRLGQDFIDLPFFGEIHLGLFYIPFFIIVMIAVYSGGVIDGIDGLSAGIFASIFTAYTAIALFQGQINLAAFCIAVVGSILAFLWFNIPPARFYMGETGVIGLTATLTVVAFLTNSVAVLPIIAFLLVITSASVIIQLVAKKIFNKKVFLAAPLHHHFEALGWPHYKVTMRYWIIGVVVAILGVVIHLLG
jgi:phospho-N-acetylmuramoyl-pentapeptide-transferase